MIHLKRLGIGALVLGAELGLFWLVMKTHWGPYLFLGAMAIGGSYFMGWAIRKGK